MFEQVGLSVAPDIYGSSAMADPELQNKYEESVEPRSNQTGLHLKS